jgi:predicted TIM-barrel fold metal-dependent hydrolase
MIDEIKIFDAHVHYLGRFKKRDENIVDYLDRYKIDKAIITTVNKRTTLEKFNLLPNENEMEHFDEVTFIDHFNLKDQLDHEEVLKLVQENEKLYGFYWFNPKIAGDDDWKLLKKYITEYDFKGVKTQMCVDLLKVPEDLFTLAEFCIKYDVPLYLHSGIGFFFQDAFRAKDYYNFIKEFPDLKCIIGHAAYTMEYCINLLRYFPDFPNVFFETSVSIPYGIMTLIKIMGDHRVIFGSDSPSATTPDIEINKIKMLNLSKKTLENVFYNNISRLIGEK